MSIVRKNIFILFLIQGTNYIFPLLTIPYLSRIFGPSGMGALALSQAIILYLVMLIDFGFNLTVTRRISIANENKNQKEINRLFTHTILIKFFFLAFSIILTFLLCQFIPQFKNIQYLIYIGFISLLGATLNPIWLFQGLQRMSILLIPTTLSKFVSLLLIFVFVNGSDDINWAMFFICLGLFISGLISILYVFKLKLAKFCKFDYLFSKNLLVESSYIFVSYLGSSIYTTMNTFIMSFFVGLRNIGIYSSADKVITTSQSLMGPLNQAIFPNLSNFNNKKEYLLKFKKFGIILTLIGFLISILIFLSSRFIVSILYGSEFYESYKILEILSILPLVISLGILFGQWGLIVIGEAKLLGKIYILGGLSHLLHIFILIYYYDIYGAAVSIVITETIVSLMLFLGFCKKIKQWN
ncbi:MULTISPECIES: flippase [Acinetobacter]|uniref:flippase n=1 Tax=Acinetobacter TaxID=469 RepID=UPI00097F6D91|nr:MULTISPECIES: flippase [Acinetobacter]MEB3796137.1 flippase [Acinetobacter sp. IK24]MEB3815287.1 flippase [Acinetobacter sp. IK22]MEB3834531.1 flippase [Acinetobacter sp. IK23]MEB3838158.1 flippase [Acinetobacter sp. IK25]ONN57723.1 hypothetical protein AC057_06795 [Acinetobacter genomosp. 33YU]